ncbi:Aste57867_19878 [Aphanomyces stellatus]|uniref:Aste57867_19878 protein n=1 Tax=Aphanomyces stellatus TaxID=120398 RepID=A0A485LDI6_9STRA|nr:hypothetical protein As57867_019812 [Aphanomyces stellatus]VFT96576.1 Aste57867_19878 [Aphanomyces stellatus]
MSGTTVAAAASDVLRSPDLLLVVCQYQRGLWQDLLPFKTIPRWFNYAMDAQKLLVPWLAEFGLVRVFRLVVSLPEWKPLVLEFAARHDQFELFQAMTQRFPDDVKRSARRLSSLAASAGSIPILSFLHNAAGFRRAKPSQLARNATDHGHFHVLQHVAETAPLHEWFRGTTLVSAVWQGRLDMLEWFFHVWAPHAVESERTRIEQWALVCAVKARQWDAARWLGLRMQDANATAIAHVWAGRRKPECLVDLVNPVDAVEYVLCTARPTHLLERLRCVFGLLPRLQEQGTHQTDAVQRCVARALDLRQLDILRWLIQSKLVARADVADIANKVLHPVEARTSWLTLCSRPLAHPRTWEYTSHDEDDDDYDDVWGFEHGDVEIDVAPVWEGVGDAQYDAQEEWGAAGLGEWGPPNDEVVGDEIVGDEIVGDEIVGDEMANTWAVAATNESALVGHRVDAVRFTNDYISLAVRQHMEWRLFLHGHGVADDQPEDVDAINQLLFEGVGCVPLAMVLANPLAKNPAFSSAKCFQMYESGSPDRLEYVLALRQWIKCLVEKQPGGCVAVMGQLLQRMAKVSPTPKIFPALYRTWLTKASNAVDKDQFVHDLFRHGQANVVKAIAKANDVPTNVDLLRRAIETNTSLGVTQRIYTIATKSLDKDKRRQLHGDLFVAAALATRFKIVRWLVKVAIGCTDVNLLLSSVGSKAMQLAIQRRDLNMVLLLEAHGVHVDDSLVDKSLNQVGAFEAPLMFLHYQRTELLSNMPISANECHERNLNPRLVRWFEWVVDRHWPCCGRARPSPQNRLPTDD